MITCWACLLKTCSCWKDKKKKNVCVMWRTASHCTVNHCIVPCLSFKHWSSTFKWTTHIISDNLAQSVVSITKLRFLSVILCSEISSLVLQPVTNDHFRCPQSMYSCPVRHNVLAPEQVYLTAFHNFSFCIFLWSCFCTWHTVYFNLHTYVFVERKKKIVCDIS